MAKFLAASLGECVHVAGVLKFLSSSNRQSSMVTIPDSSDQPFRRIP